MGSGRTVEVEDAFLSPAMAGLFDSEIGSLTLRPRERAEISSHRGDRVAQLVEPQPRDPMDSMTRGSNPARIPLDSFGA